MISAKELFEICGYRYHEDNSTIQCFTKYNRYDFIFWKKRKFLTSFNFEIINDKMTATELLPIEIKAIYQQMKELGWYE